MGLLYTVERAAQEEQQAAASEAVDPTSGSLLGGGGDATDDQDLYFEPSKGNVVFASAASGWGFSVQNFARVIAEKLKCSAKPLCQTLWGDFYLTSLFGGIHTNVFFF
jgi:hypothetical protein